MEHHPLKLIPSNGDLTLSRVRFVVHYLQRNHEAATQINEGLPIILGAASFATDLPGVLLAPSPGGNADLARAIIVRVPQNFHIGPGSQTAVIIDRDVKSISGYPLAYSTSRQHLALYADADIEAGRAQIEADIANGYTLEQHPTYAIDPQYLVGSIVPSSELRVLMSQLQVRAEEWRELDYGRLTHYFVQYFDAAAVSRWGAPEEILAELIRGTVESRVLARLRWLRLQGLHLLGYQLHESVTKLFQVSSLADHRKLLDQLERRVETPLFSGDLQWLASFITTQLRIMRLELDEKADLG